MSVRADETGHFEACEAPKEGAPQLLKRYPYAICLCPVPCRLAMNHEVRRAKHVISSYSLALRLLCWIKFPTCQLRVLRFYVSCLPPPSPPRPPSPLRPPPPPILKDGSIPRRTSTASFSRLAVFPTGPQTSALCRLPCVLYEAGMFHKFNTNISL